MLSRLFGLEEEEVTIMDMYEKYIGCGNLKPKLICAGIIAAESIVYALIVNIFAANRAEAAGNIIYAVCYLPYTIIIALELVMSFRCSFLANDIGVTFRQPFARKTTIWYKDIEDIIVYRTPKTHILFIPVNGKLYEDVIAVRTASKEYVFRALATGGSGGRTFSAGELTEESEKTGFGALKSFIDTKISAYRQKRQA